MGGQLAERRRRRHGKLCGFETPRRFESEIFAPRRGDQLHADRQSAAGSHWGRNDRQAQT
jgi:hypothetical protein